MWIENYELRFWWWKSPIVEVCDFDTIQKAFEMRGTKKCCWKCMMTLAVLKRSGCCFSCCIKWYVKLNIFCDNYHFSKCLLSLLYLSILWIFEYDYKVMIIDLLSQWSMFLPIKSYKMTYEKLAGEDLITLQKEKGNICISVIVPLSLIHIYTWEKVCKEI